MQSIDLRWFGADGMEEEGKHSDLERSQYEILKTITTPTTSPQGEQSRSPSHAWNLNLPTQDAFMQDVLSNDPFGDPDIWRKELPTEKTDSGSQSSLPASEGNGQGFFFAEQDSPAFDQDNQRRKDGECGDSSSHSISGSDEPWFNHASCVTVSAVGQSGMRNCSTVPDEFVVLPLKTFELSQLALGRVTALSKPLFRYDGLFVTGTEEPDKSDVQSNVIVGLLFDDNNDTTKKESGPGIVSYAVPVSQHVRDLAWLRPQTVLLALGSRLALLHLPQPIGCAPAMDHALPSENTAAPKSGEVAELNVHSIKVFDDLPPIHSDMIRQVAVSEVTPHLVISGGFDSRVCVSDFTAVSGPSAARVSRVHEAGDVVGSVCWLPSSEHLCSWTTDPGLFSMFDLRAPRIVMTYNAECDELFTHAYYDDNLVLLGFGDGTIDVVDTRNAKKLLSWKDPYVSAVGELVLSQPSRLQGSNLSLPRTLAVFGLNEFSCFKQKFACSMNGLVSSTHELLGHHRPSRKEISINSNIISGFPSDVDLASILLTPTSAARTADGKGCMPLVHNSTSNETQFFTRHGTKVEKSSSPLEAAPGFDLSSASMSASKRTTLLPDKISPCNSSTGDEFTMLPTAIPLPENCLKESCVKPCSIVNEFDLETDSYYKTSGTFLANSGRIGVTDSFGTLSIYEFGEL